MEPDDIEDEITSYVDIFCAEWDMKKIEGKSGWKMFKKAIKRGYDEGSCFEIFVEKEYGGALFCFFAPNEDDAELRDLAFTLVNLTKKE